MPITDKDRERWAALGRASDAWRQGVISRRSAANVSVAKLAGAAHVSTSTVRRIEDGTPYWPTLHTLAAVSHALGWPLDDLAETLAEDPALVAVLTLEHRGITGYEVIAKALGAVPL